MTSSEPKRNLKIAGRGEELRRPVPAQPYLLKFLFLSPDVGLNCKQWTSWLYSDVQKWFHEMYAAGYVTTPGTWERSGFNE